MSRASQSIVLKAPLTGALMPICQVPDPVFAQKMVGDGIALDPVTNQLCSPCDGEITQLHSAGHAVTVRSNGGAEILMHIGLDTVMLKGEGFESHVKEGDKVTAGQLLITFDADLVAQKAISLLTMIVITNSDEISGFEYGEGYVLSGSDTVLTLSKEGAADAAAASAAPADTLVSEAIIVPNPTGLHARPSAVLANMAKKFSSEIKLERDGSFANAKSVVAIMGLEVGNGDKIHLHVSGTDAQAALDTLVPELVSGLGEEGCTPAAAPASIEKSADEAPVKVRKSDDPNVLLGVSASPGMAVGTVFQMKEEALEVVEAPKGDSHAERTELDHALAAAKTQLQAMQENLKQEADDGKAAIFAAHEELLEDPDLLDIATSAIEKGKSAAFAWQGAFTTHANVLAGLKNEVLAGRANDLRDVGRRVLRIMLGIEEQALELPENTVLIAEDLTPSDTANIDRSKVVGFVTTLGGASSHAAIIARSLDLPYVAGIEAHALDVANGSNVVLDGNKGSLRLNPSDEEITRIREWQKRQAIKREADLAAAFEPAVTSCGHHVEVCGNIGGLEDAEQTVKMGGEGVGLLRSEFLYMDRPTAPTEDEQTEIYSDIAKALGKDKPLIVRTLDVGGDKPLAYINLGEEENPFLGERGIRLCLNRPELLRTQVRAILKAAGFCKMRIMFPMIATIDEIRQAKQVVEEERAALNAPAVEIGMMVEVPVTAVMSEQFAREVDFFSIGTNDLTQYTLAMDRGHPKLAAQCDALNPGVLGLIRQTCEGAKKGGAWVGVCGGVASDPQAVPLLIGLGVHELSASVPTIPAIKAQVRTLTLAQCQKLAEQALACDSAADVRALVPQEGL